MNVKKRKLFFREDYFIYKEDPSVQIFGNKEIQRKSKARRKKTA